MGQNVTIVCGNCKKQSVAPIELVGKQARCPSCKAVFVVQMASPPVAQPRPSAPQPNRPPTQAAPRPAAGPVPGQPQRQPTGATSARLPAQGQPQPTRQPTGATSARLPAQGQPPRPATQSLPVQQPAAAPGPKTRLSQMRGKSGARYRMPPKKSSKKTLYFVVTLIVIAGMGASLAWILGAFENHEENIKNRFKAFVAALNAEKLDEAKKFFFDKSVPNYLEKLFKMEFDLTAGKVTVDLSDGSAFHYFEGKVHIKNDEKEKREVAVIDQDKVNFIWKRGGDKNWYISSTTSDRPFYLFLLRYNEMMEQH